MTHSIENHHDDDSRIAKENGRVDETTKLNRELVAGTAMHLLSHGVSTHAKDGVPSAAVFAQGLGVLDPHLRDIAGSSSRYAWLERMKQVDEDKIGPVRGWLNMITGQENHPFVRQSIDWIEQYGDKTSTPLMMLLSDLYMAAGESEKAKKTYGDALKSHAESGSSSMLME